MQSHVAILSPISMLANLSWPKCLFEFTGSGEEPWVWKCPGWPSSVNGSSFITCLVSLLLSVLARHWIWGRILAFEDLIAQREMGSTAAAVTMLRVGAGAKRA